MWRRLLKMCWIILAVETSVPVFADTKEIQWENQVPDDVSIITEISVQELVNGKIIQRKPTKEELNLVQDKILERAPTDFNEDNGQFSTSIKSNAPAAVEELSSIFKSDSNDADLDLFDDWNGQDKDDDNDEDPKDMESILRDSSDDFDDNRDKTRGNKEMDKNASNEKDKNNLLNEKSITPSEKSPSGDYRKFFHTEKKNFSNVKEIKIVINEEEGDFFDIDEDPFFVKTTTHATVLKQGTDKFDLIKEILASVEMNRPVNNSSDFNEVTATAPSFENKTLPNIISEVSPESSDSTFSTTMKTDDNNNDNNVNTTDSKQSTTMLPEDTNTFVELSPDSIDSTTVISSFEDEEVAGINELQENTSHIAKDYLVTTTIAPEISKETTTAPDIQDSITFKAIPDENGPVSETTTASNSQAEISSTETSTNVEEIVKTSTSSEISEDLVVTLTGPISESDVVTESTRENRPEYNTSTSTVLPVTVSSIDYSEAEGNVASEKVFLPTTVSDSDIINGTVEVLTELEVVTTLAISPENTVAPTKLPDFSDAESTEAVDGETLAENGVSVPDISEIMSLVENSYHEITSDDLGNSDISNIKEIADTTIPVFKEPDSEATTPYGTTVRDLVVTIPADTFTEQILLDSTENMSSTIPSVGNEETEVEKASTSSTIEEFITYPSETEPASVLLELESSTIEPSYTTENGSLIFIVTAVDYSEVSTENVNIGGSTGTPIVTTSVDNMDHKTPPASIESNFSDSTEDKVAKISTSTEMQSTGAKLTVVDQTTQLTMHSSTSNKDTKASTFSETDEIETHNLTPSEVESILNAQLEEYEEDDYDTKEGIEGWTLFGGNEKEKDVATAHNVDLAETDKNSLEDYDPVIAVGSQMTPVLRGRILNNSAEFNVKISKKDDTSYIPATACIKEYGRIMNITWKATADQNNSLAMRLFENEKFYIIKEIILYVFRGNKFTLQRKSVAINPDPIMDDTMPGRTRVVMMRDGTYITFSNVEFLRIADSSSDRAENSASASRSQKLWHFEVASISITTILIVAIVLYVVALKRKTKITLMEKDELPQVTNC